LVTYTCPPLNTIVRRAERVATISAVLTVGFSL
jgi:hypothetical protein